MRGLSRWSPRNMCRYDWGSRMRSPSWLQIVTRVCTKISTPQRVSCEKCSSPTPQAFITYRLNRRDSPARVLVQSWMFSVRRSSASIPRALAFALGFVILPKDAHHKEEAADGSREEKR